MQMPVSYSRKKFFQSQAQAQRMETVLRCHDEFGQRDREKIAAAARFFPQPSGINWFYRVLA